MNVANRTFLQDLTPAFGDVNIVGVVIGKQGARSFRTKKDPSQERHVISFTVRDSPADFINVTCWGSQNYVQSVDEAVNLGYVVSLENVSAQYKQSDGSSEKYHPKTPGELMLVAGEHRSHIAPYDGPDQNVFTTLIHVPSKSNNDFYTIADIEANGRNLHGEFVSLLVAVKSVGAEKNWTSKTGRELSRREVKVFDNSAQSFTLVLWDEVLINLANFWKPKENVIFAADVKITFDDYKKKLIATATSNTIITTDPDTKEAILLHEYGQTAELEEEVEETGTSFGHTTNLEDISDVYSVQQIKHLLNGQQKQYGITFAYVTTFNIDFSEMGCVMTKCAKCRKKVGESGKCENQNCLQAGGELETNTQFRVSMSISDDTGTIPTCQLTDDAAQMMIDAPVNEFLFMSEEERTHVKWRFQLERCKIYFRAEPRTPEWSKPTLRVLSSVVADPEEAMAYMQ